MVIKLIVFHLNISLDPMPEQKDPSHQSAASGERKGTKNLYDRQNSIARFMEQIHSVNSLYLIGGACQFVLGVSVVMVSVLGLIQPLWLSTLLSILASVTTMTGVYFCYNALPTEQKDTLIRDAMRRIVEQQN
jgi:hypothetical protein